jgi:hypothetical protein
MENTREHVGVVAAGSVGSGSIATADPKHADPKQADPKHADPKHTDTEHDLFDGRLALALVPGLSGEELARRLAVVARAGEVCHRALAFYLHDMESRRIHHALGFATAVDFARHRLGSKGRTLPHACVGRCWRATGIAASPARARAA